MTRKPASARIVDAIIKDFSDRRGFRQNWEAIDKPIRKEIRETWVGLAEAAVSDAQATARRRTLDEVADYLAETSDEPHRVNDSESSAATYHEAAQAIRGWR